MKTWNDFRLRDALARTPRPTPGEAPAFWATFQERARVREQAAEAAVAAGWPVFARWATAAAGLLVMLSLAGIPLWLHHDAVPGYSRVQSLEVVASHSGVVIMDDEASQSTIVLIMDMDKGGG